MTRAIDRRTLLKTTAAALAGASAGLRPWRSARAQSTPIKIGFLAPLTGVIASGGREMVDGANMWLERVKSEAGGRKIDLIVEDDGSTPDIALQKARRLVEQNEVHFLMGCLLANTGLAVANYVKGNGVPYFLPIIAADDLTQRARVKNVIRSGGYTSSQTTHPFGDWALKQGYKKIATISQDYAFGHEQCGGFAQVFTEGGGQILQQFWNPLNTADFSPYLGQLASLPVDAIFAMETGADATRFIQQYASFGLKGRIPLLGAMNATDQSVIRTMGAETEGIFSASQFCEGSENPVTQKWVKDYTDKYSKLPSVYGVSTYSGMMWITKALDAIGGKAEDREALLDAVPKIELTESPLGKTVKLDAYGNPIFDIYIRKVVKRDDGKHWNVAIETYPNVSQFWKYDPETYLKQPSYSRQFQGIKKT
jgi:branched-chain amino acid transport system substrate-binding protein